MPLRIIWTSVKAKYISGSGAEGTAAVIEVGGEQYECMDCLCYGRSRCYQPGDIIYVAFTAGLVKEHRHGKVQAGANPQRRKALESLGGWRYRAYGEVLEVSPGTLLDCGAVEVDMSYVIGDEEMIGSFVTIDIARLDCWRTRKR